VTSEGALIRKTMTHGKQLPQRLGAASAGKKADCLWRAASICSEERDERFKKALE
jgi:hypothetical protein